MKIICEINFTNKTTFLIDEIYGIRVEFEQGKEALFTTSVANNL